MCFLFNSVLFKIRASFINQDLIIIFVTFIITNANTHTLHFHWKTLLWDQGASGLGRGELMGRRLGEAGLMDVELQGGVGAGDAQACTGAQAPWAVR